VSGLRLSPTTSIEYREVQLSLRGHEAQEAAGTTVNEQ
jgi:hypothetical protein